MGRHHRKSKADNTKTGSKVKEIMPKRGKLHKNDGNSIEKEFKSKVRLSCNTQKLYNLLRPRELY